MATPNPDPFSTSGLTPPTSTDPTHIGDYRLVGRIGAGGMGTVYGAVDTANSPVALKMVHQEYAVDAEFRARFTREVDLLGRVTGRCVPHFLSADTTTQRPWLATEYVRGLTLRQHVSRHGPLSGPTLYGLAMGMAEALQAIHTTGIVHRDLKPGNVILAPDGPKVLDFGIARAVEESAITRTGLLGTPGWIAPEQFDSTDPTSAADLFAWGGLVAFAATGREPFGTGPPDVLTLRTVEEPPDLNGVPPELYPLVEAALAKDPAARPTASQALVESTHLLSGHAPANATEATSVVPSLLDQQWAGATPDSPDATGWAQLAPPKRRRWRRRLLVPAAAMLALVLLGTGGVLAWQGLAPNDEGSDNTTDNGESEGNGAGDNGTGTDADPSEDELDALEHGGTGLLGDAAAEELDVGTVRTDLIENDTLQLGTSEATGEAGDLTAGDVEPRVTITFQSAQSEEDGMRFTGEVEYLTPVGTFVLHSGDFVAYEFDYPSAEERMERFSEDEEVLALLDEDNPTEEFDFFIPAAPNDDYNYIEYELPPELWGYEIDADTHYGSSRWCYRDGDAWYDEEGIDVEGMPCD